MSIYYLSLFHLPSKVAHSLDKIFRDFYWESTQMDGGMHNITWKTTQLPQLMGSLEIGNLKHRNKAPLAKWIWRSLHEKNGL